MSNLRQMQMMEKLLQTLIEKISKYTSRGFAANLIAKAIMYLREKNVCLENILINETRYEEGFNTFTITEYINDVEQKEFFKSVKNLIEKTMECFDNNIDIHFINDLRNELPEIFYYIDNLETEIETDKKKILLINDNEKINCIIKEFENISEQFSFTFANSGVQCFDMLVSGYIPDLIIINFMMDEKVVKNIYFRLKNNSIWKEIPIILIINQMQNLKNEILKNNTKNSIENPFELNELKEIIEEQLFAKNIQRM